MGRPNVGKSTLFNRLTKSRDALVHDKPGLTRDRQFGNAKLDKKEFIVVDTGGFEPVVDSGILHEMAKQTMQAVDEADAIIFVCDGRLGVTGQDKLIAQKLRECRAPVFVAVNKGEGCDKEVFRSEFFELGLSEPRVISAAHGDGVNNLLREVLDTIDFKKFEDRWNPDEASKNSDYDPDSDEFYDVPSDDFMKLGAQKSSGPAPAPTIKEGKRRKPGKENDERDNPVFVVVGRPNVGKSTLINTILGEERVIAFNEAGTTRDSIYIDFERNGQKFTIVDTAGVRKRGKVNEVIEKFSVIKTLQAIESANVVVLVLDATQDVAQQDASLASYAMESGRALVIAVNKWDALNKEEREEFRNFVARKLIYLDFAEIHYISAMKNQKVDDLFKSIRKAYEASLTKMGTPHLNRLLRTAVERQQPPVGAGRIRPKLRYAHQGGMNPPTIIIHGNSLDNVPDSYTRYLTDFFRRAFKLEGSPLKIEYISQENPFEEKGRGEKKGLRRSKLSNRIAKKETKKALKSKIRDAKRDNKVSIKKK